MFNKKGVSEVVANVLIVLLVIVGIAVIWSVVKPTIDKSAQGVRSDCFTVQVEPVSCSNVGTCTGGAGATCTNLITKATCVAVTSCTWTTTDYKVTVKRNPGAGSFDSVEAIFSDGTNAERKTLGGITSTTPEELASATSDLVPISSLTTSGFNAGVNNPIKTANIVLKANGQLCQVTTQPVNCV